MSPTAENPMLQRLERIAQSLETIARHYRKLDAAESQTFADLTSVRLRESDSWD